MSTEFGSIYSGPIRRSLERLSNFGNAEQFVPTLGATTTPPNLGTTGSATGWFSRVGDLVYFQFVFLFGGTGITNGTGTYQVLPPVLPRGISGSSNVVRGAITVRDSSAVQQRVFAPVFGATFMNFRPFNTAAFGAEATITDATVGITFAANDSVVGQVLYHAAD